MLLEIIFLRGDDIIEQIVLLCGKRNADLIEVFEELNARCNIVFAVSENEIKKRDIVIADKTLAGNDSRVFAFIIDAAVTNFGYHDENVITCGISSKATVSISSKTEEETVLSIQRELMNIYGETIEPQDFVIRTSRMFDDFIFAAAATAVILCTKKHGNNYR